MRQHVNSEDMVLKAVASAPHHDIYPDISDDKVGCGMLHQVTALEQRCQQLEAEVQKLAQSWSEAAPAEEIQVSLKCVLVLGHAVDVKIAGLHTAAI